MYWDETVRKLDEAENHCTIQKGEKSPPCKQRQPQLPTYKLFKDVLKMGDKKQKRQPEGVMTVVQGRGKERQAESSQRNKDLCPDKAATACHRPSG